MTNVLVVDDDEIFAQTLCEYLEDSGGIKIVKRCASYTEAKDWFSQGNLKDVDAVILDLILPFSKEPASGSTRSKVHTNDRLGLRVLDDLRKEHCFIGPIVMLTNSRESLFGKAALERGCNGYLCKHASAESIPQMVAELRLALTGQVVLISTALHHLVIEEDQMQTSQSQNSCANAGQLMDLIGQNPLWVDIKKGLGYSSIPGTPSDDPVFNRIIRDFRTSPSEQLFDTLPRPLTLQPVAEEAGLVRQLLESAPRAIFITTPTGIIVFSNQATAKLFGHEKETYLGQNITEFFPELDDVFKEGGSIEQEFYAVGADGHPLPVSVASSTITESNYSYAVHIFTDLTSQKITEQKLKAMVSKLEESSTKLEQLVKTDPLTGLLNRRGLENILNREMALARRNRSDLTAMVIDLDDFKSINDRYGHAIGDKVLKAVSSVLHDTVRTSDWLGRIGGDEFMIFLPSTSLDNGAVIAERIRAAIQATTIGKNGSALRATTSIGVARLSYDVSSLEEVLELTKAGLKASKSSGKNVVSISRNATASGASQSLHSRDLLNRRDEFSVVHQPIYNFQTGRPVAVELFARGPLGELHMPKDFLFVAGVNNILTEVDVNCLNMCLEYGLSLSQHLILHINILPSTLAELPTDQVLGLSNQLRQSRQLCLELSEKHLMSDPGYLLPKIRILKDAGILLALDDVGFGCSSLETLTLFEPDCIKIDHSLVSAIATDPRKSQTVARLAQVAHSLNTVPIAEGIETIADLVEVKRLGVTHGQGWLWQKTADAARH